MGPEKDSQTAAIATHKAAKLHGLQVIASDIGNDVFMETRYILIRKAGDNSAVAWSTPSHLDTARKRSACFAISNEPGGLWKLLSVYALRGLNVFKVEAR